MSNALPSNTHWRRDLPNDRIVARRDGAVGGHTLRLFAIGLPVLLAGTWVGLQLNAQLDEAGFRKLVLILLLMLGPGFVVRGS